MQRIILVAMTVIAAPATVAAHPDVDLCGDGPDDRRQVVAVRHMETGATLDAWSAAGSSARTVTVPDGGRMTFRVSPVPTDFYRERADQLPLPEMVRVEVYEGARDMSEPLLAHYAGANTVERLPSLGVTLALARPRCIHRVPEAP